MNSNPLPPPSGKPPVPRMPGILGRILASVAMLAALAVGVMFSAILVAVALVVGVVFFGYLWWVKRRMMKQLRSHPAFADLVQQRPPQSDVIEGEVIHSEWKDRKRP